MDNDALNELGQTFRRSRKALKKTLREAAKEADLSPSYLGRLETGSLSSPPSKEALERLAKAVKIEPRKLLAMREAFYRNPEGRLRAARSPRSGRTVQQFAALAEGALIAARQLIEEREVVDAIPLAEAAVDLFERSNQLIGRVRAEVTLSEAYVSYGYDLEFNDAPPVQVVEVLARAVETLASMIRNFEAIAEPEPADEQRFLNALAQGGRVCMRLARTESSQSLLDEAAAVNAMAQVALRSPATPGDRRLLEHKVGALAENFVKDTEPLFPKLAESFHVLGLRTALELSSLSLFERSVNEYGAWVERMTAKNTTVEEEATLALGTKNYANALRDQLNVLSTGKDTVVAKRTRERVRDLFIWSIERLRQRLPKVLPQQAHELRNRLAEAHQELGFVLGQLEDRKESFWQYTVALGLDPKDQFARGMRLRQFLSDLRKNHGKHASEAEKKIQELEPAPDFVGFSYPVLLFRGK